MESTWPEAHRRDGDPQPPQFRAFALPGISIATLRDGMGGKRAGGGKGSNSAATALASMNAYIYTQMEIQAHRVYAHARDCVYAESYLPRLKSHRGESRGRSALGIASARAIASTLLRFPLNSIYLPPPPRGSP